MKKRKKKRAEPPKSGNLAMAKAMQGLRRSSAASPHTPAPDKGTRAEKKRRAVEDQEG